VRKLRTRLEVTSSNPRARVYFVPKRIASSTQSDVPVLSPMTKGATLVPVHSPGTRGPPFASHLSPGWNFRDLYPLPTGIEGHLSTV
jgi:hypothetical protein